MLQKGNLDKLASFVKFLATDGGKTFVQRYTKP